MSSILKALRKLEEEKAASRDGGLDIGRDILRIANGRQTRVSWMLPVLALAAAALVGWGAYLFSRRENLQETASSLVGTNPDPVPAMAAIEPVRSKMGAVGPSTQGKSARPYAGAEPPILEEVLDREVPASFPASVKNTPIAGGKLAPAEPLAAEPAPVVRPEAAPAFLLSAISYHDDPDARLAVINDLPVMIGSVVEDAVVDDILRDRVRLTQNGKSFEVPLQN